MNSYEVRMTVACAVCAVLAFFFAYAWLAERRVSKAFEEWCAVQATSLNALAESTGLWPPKRRAAKAHVEPPPLPRRLTVALPRDVIMRRRTGVFELPRFRLAGDERDRS